MDDRAPRREVSGRAGQKARTREALLAAARRLTDERGAGGLVLREVAREAGVVPTAFYRHFADLDALAEELLDAGARALAEVLRASGVAGAGDPGVAEAAQLLHRGAQERADALGPLLRAREGGPPDQRARCRALLTRAAEDLRVDLARAEDLAHRDAEGLAEVADVLLSEVLAALAHGRAGDVDRTAARLRLVRRGAAG